MTIYICKRRDNKSPEKLELFPCNQFMKREFLVLFWETLFTLIAYLSS